MALPHYPDVSQDLQDYVIEEIVPLYNDFDTAHHPDHAESVIRESMTLARHYEVKLDMVYAIAAFHDLGLCEGREHHHEVSARIIRQTSRLRQWFTEEEIDLMAEAAEDHRASSKHAPRTIYGCIVAEADRLIDTETVLQRTVQYGLSHYPDLSREQHFARMVEHLHEKYAEGGYLKLWIPESKNAERLAELREVIKDEHKLREIFARLYKDLKNSEITKGPNT